MYNRASLIDGVEIGNVSPTQLAEIEDADILVRQVSLLFILTVIATGVVFIIWQFRYAKNAVALGGRLGLGPGWAIGGWFIPLANLILPLLQLRQSARASAGRVPGIVTAWMVTYIVAGVVTLAAAGFPRSPSTSFTQANTALADLAQADRTLGMAMLIYAAAGVLGILMVRELTRGQQRAPGARSQLAG